MRSFVPALAFMASALTACASTSPPQPTEITAERSDRLAALNDERGALHEAKYNPKARTSAGRCAGGGRDPGLGLGVCWSSEENPTADHLKRAQRYHALAEKQRAESERLRSAESQACDGVAVADREMSPFSHPEDVAAVEQLLSTTNPPRLEGALITFQSVEGMTAPRLERLVSCHLARNACLENAVSEMAYCPLTLKNVKASVAPTTGGLFVVAVRAEDPAVAQEILRRSQALLSH
ncbi:MAG: hypothetical protein ABI193_14985 [Minicystis sp.]